MLDAKAVLLAEILYGEDMGFERVAEVETELAQAVEDWLADRGAAEMEMIRTGDCLRFQTAVGEAMLSGDGLFEELARLCAPFAAEGLRGRAFLMVHDGGPVTAARFDDQGLRATTL